MAEHWQVYLPMMLMSFVLMVPLIVIAEKKARLKEIFLLAIALIALVEWGLSLFDQSIWSILVLMIVFFTAFNLLEASLPSMVAKFAPADKKGTAMGVYSSSQFMGAFAGGLLGGVVYDQFGLEAVFQMAALLALVWWFVANRMEKPAQLGTWMLNTGALDDAQAEQLKLQIMQAQGVFEAVWVKEDGIFYLKVDNRIVNKEVLEKFSKHEGDK
jgi:MFS family permease